MFDNGVILYFLVVFVVRVFVMIYVKYNVRFGVKFVVKKYYKYWVELGLGKGNVLMEVCGEKIVWQVEIYGIKMVWVDEYVYSDDCFLLVDQLVLFLDFDEDDEIFVCEFESVWKKVWEVIGYLV